MRWWAAVCGALVASSGMAADLGARLDAQLTTSAGKPTRLSAYFGKPMLVFYEDIDSAKINQTWKAQLARRSAKLGLTERLTGLGVCDLGALNWEPALSIALLVVRGEEAKARVPVLVDLTGVLARAPWNLSAKQSSIVLLSADGTVLFEAVGLMSAQTYAQLELALTHSLDPTLASAP